MPRSSTPTAQRYAAFWSQLLPLSNRRTGFSIRSPRRHPTIEFCYLGFCFRYWLQDDQPDARVQFALERSDADTIYATLSGSRAVIEQAFGAPLVWHHEPFARTRQATLYEIAYRIPSSPLRDLPPKQWSDLMIHVRPYLPDDRAFVLSLAPRLIIGLPPWRDPKLCISAFQDWISVAIEQHGQKTMVFVAEDEGGERLGFATLSHETHFTGEPQAYINELATSEVAEGSGVGTALLQACEQWARDQGYRILALSTGAANVRALGFYHHLGFRDEDVKLIKLMEHPGGVTNDR